MKKRLPIGIDDMAFYAPHLYFDIQDLAEKRQIPFEKLRDGLGLHKMAIPDVHEDAATMAAEAIIELIDRNNLDPRTIGRIYMGTESALDMAKPTATYAMDMVRNRLQDRYGADCLRRCDALDMTFACIAGMDALLTTMDWVAAQPDRIGIVVASDVAKYELESTGEYTQGAGAVAMLVKSHPRLLNFSTVMGVATEPAHDFFKPRREKFTETPVFDGQFSNQCYQDRMTEALVHFREEAIRQGLFKENQYAALSTRWSRMAFHLPYAFHAKRMYVEQFVNERKAAGKWPADQKKYAFSPLETMRFESEAAYKKAYNALLKSVSESKLYKDFVAEKIEKSQQVSGQMGNLYTASVWLALMATFEADQFRNAPLAGKRIGLVGYGSGSKAKVLEATVCAGWHAVAERFNITEKLNRRKAIDYPTYVALHEGTLTKSVAPQKGRFGLDRIGTEGVTLGARYYKTL